jgi:pimeloyl-ACP methyl ester carboxylesterase
MSALEATSGHTRNGLPYNKLGHGADTLVVFDGIGFENSPSHGIEARLTLPMYEFLSSDYTVFVVKRRKGLPQGSTVRDMSDDYAEMIRQEFGGPVDLIGYSSGGVIAQVFAADHPDLVRKLVLQSSACRESPLSRELILQARDLALKGEWTRCIATMMEAVYRPSWYKAALIRVVAPLSTLAGVPTDPSDFAVEVEAEDGFDFADRLGEISAPTLLVVTDRDLELYTPEAVRETAAGIPDCRLIIYSGMGHPAKGRQFERDVLAFLRQ